MNELEGLDAAVVSYILFPIALMVSLSGLLCFSWGCSIPRAELREKPQKVHERMKKEGKL